MFAEKLWRQLFAGGNAQSLIEGKRTMELSICISEVLVKPIIRTKKQFFIPEVVSEVIIRINGTQHNTQAFFFIHF